MEKKLIIALSACTLVTCCMINQQAYAYSETSYEMSEGSAYGDETAGPVGAAVGGLFGGAVGLVKDTGNAVSGRSADERVIVHADSDDDIILTDDDLYADEEANRSETAKGFDAGASEGEQVAGAPGAAVGGVLGGAVGLAEDAVELVTGRPAEVEEISDEDNVAMYDYNNDVERELTIADVE